MLDDKWEVKDLDTFFLLYNPTSIKKIYEEKWLHREMTLGEKKHLTSE